jgi:hypothetical protein
VIWERSGDAYYAVVIGSDDKALIRLVVEPHGNQWDWVVWRPDQGPDKARHGIAGTVQEAMRDAESAAGNTIP